MCKTTALSPGLSKNAALLLLKRLANLETRDFLPAEAGRSLLLWLMQRRLLQGLFDESLQTPVPGSQLQQVQQGTVTVDTEPLESYVAVIINTGSPAPATVVYGLAVSVGPEGRV